MRCWRKKGSNLGSHWGGRKQNSTTEATSRESPITPIVEEVGGGGGDTVFGQRWGRLQMMKSSS